MNYDNIEISLAALYMTAGLVVSVPTAYLDKEMIDREKVGFWYHNAKFWGTIAILLSFSYYYLKLDIWESLTLMACTMIAYSLSFDIILNVLRGKHWNYIGKTAQFDKMARIVFKNGENYAFVKGMCLVALGIIHTLIFNK